MAAHIVVPAVFDQATLLTCLPAQGTKLKVRNVQVLVQVRGNGRSSIVHQKPG